MRLCLAFAPSRRSSRASRRVGRDGRNPTNIGVLLGQIDGPGRGRNHQVNQDLPSIFHQNHQKGHLCPRNRIRPRHGHKGQAETHLLLVAHRPGPDLAEAERASEVSPRFGEFGGRGRRCRLYSAGSWNPPALQTPCHAARRSAFEPPTFPCHTIPSDPSTWARKQRGHPPLRQRHEVEVPQAVASLAWDCVSKVSINLQRNLEPNIVRTR